MKVVSRRRFLAIGGLGALAARLLGTERPAVSAPEHGRVIVGHGLGEDVREGDLLALPECLIHPKPFTVFFRFTEAGRV